MGLFSRFKKKEQYAFVFVCRGPDPTGMTNMIRSFHIPVDGLYDSMRHFGFTGPMTNLFFYGPEWNGTRYSSWKVTADEGDDLLEKIKKKLREKGFTYNGEDLKTGCYDESSTYAKMGLFIAYMFIEK